MLLLHWSKGYYDCKVNSLGSGSEPLVEVICTEKTTPKSSNHFKSYPITQFQSFDSYWRSFIHDPDWFQAWPIYIHPSLKKMILESLYRVPLRELSPSRISCLDKWKTYLHFRIPSDG